MRHSCGKRLSFAFERKQRRRGEITLSVAYSGYVTVVKPEKNWSAGGAEVQPGTCSSSGENTLTSGLSADHRQELAARGLILAERAEHPAGCHHDAGLMYAARRHALMCCLDHHGDALRF